MLWARLRRHGLGVPFHRQHPIGPFIVDFLCPGYALIVELDGDIHNRPVVQEQDVWREDWLIRHNFRLLRFRNQQVVNDVEVVVVAVHSELADLKDQIEQKR